MPHRELPRNENGDVVGAKQSNIPIWQVLAGIGTVVLSIFGMIHFFGGYATQQEITTINSMLESRRTLVERNTQRIEDLEKNTKDRFDALDGRVGRIEGKVDVIDGVNSKVDDMYELLKEHLRENGQPHLPRPIK